MLQIIALLLTICFAIHTTWVVFQQQAIFAELDESDVAHWLVWLYWLPFGLPLYHRFFLFLFFPLPLGALFFVPAIVAARGTLERFDRSGHPRVKAAATAMRHVVTFGIIGVMGICILTALLWFQRRSY